MSMADDDDDEAEASGPSARGRREDSGGPTAAGGVPEEDVEDDADPLSARWPSGGGHCKARPKLISTSSSESSGNTSPAGKAGSSSSSSPPQRRSLPAVARATKGRRPVTTSVVSSREDIRRRLAAAVSSTRSELVALRGSAPASRKGSIAEDLLPGGGDVRTSKNLLICFMNETPSDYDDEDDEDEDKDEDKDEDEDEDKDEDKDEDDKDKDKDEDDDGPLDDGGDEVGGPGAAGAAADGPLEPEIGNFSEIDLELATVQQGGHPADQHPPGYLSKRGSQPNLEKVSTKFLLASANISSKRGHIIIPLNPDSRGGPEEEEASTTVGTGATAAPPISASEQVKAIQAEARRRLRLAKVSAAKQVEQDRRIRRRREAVHSEVARLVVGGRPFEVGRKLNRWVLTELNVGQLQVILNHLLARVEALNESLVEYLMTRDELTIKQDSLLTDLEDVTKCIASDPAAGGPPPQDPPSPDSVVVSETRQPTSI